jgi:hypothetical protein
MEEDASQLATGDNPALLPEAGGQESAGGERAAFLGDSAFQDMFPEARLGLMAEVASERVQALVDPTQPVPHVKLKVRAAAPEDHQQQAQRPGNEEQAAQVTLAVLFDALCLTIACTGEQWKLLRDCMLRLDEAVYFDSSLLVRLSDCVDRMNRRRRRLKSSSSNNNNSSRSKRSPRALCA